MTKKTRINTVQNPLHSTFYKKDTQLYFETCSEYQIHSSLKTPINCNIVDKRGRMKRQVNSNEVIYRHFLLKRTSLLVLLGKKIKIRKASGFTSINYI